MVAAHSTTDSLQDLRRLLLLRQRYPKRPSATMQALQDHPKSLALRVDLVPFSEIASHADSEMARRWRGRRTPSQTRATLPRESSSSRWAALRHLIGLAVRLPPCATRRARRASRSLHPDSCRPRPSARPSRDCDDVRVSCLAVAEQPRPEPAQRHSVCSVNDRFVPCRRWRSARFLASSCFLQHAWRAGERAGACLGFSGHLFSSFRYRGLAVRNEVVVVRAATLRKIPAGVEVHGARLCVLCALDAEVSQCTRLVDFLWSRSRRERDESWGFLAHYFPSFGT